MGLLERLHEKYPVVKAVIYGRYSSDMQREESIEAQYRIVGDYAKHNGVEIIRRYADRGISGTTDQRPEFQQMISDARKGEFQLVLVHKLDRFARSRYDSIGYRMELKKHNVALFSVTEQFDSDSPESVMTESIIEAMNEFYVLNLAREVSKGLKENAYKCMHTGGIPPLGYDVDSAKHLVINEHEAEAVRIIFNMALIGDGYTSIINTLNEKGFKTKIGRNFGKGSIYEILRNEKYCGTLVYNKSFSKKLNGKSNRHKYKADSEIIRVDDGIPAIIPKETFKKVSELLQRRKHKAGRFSAKENYLLSGKLICGECGSHYIGYARKERPDHPYYVNYQCPKKHGAVKCSNTGVLKDDIEHFVLSRLSEHIFDDSLIPKLISAYKEYSASCDTQTQNQLVYSKDKLKNTNKQIDNIVGIMASTGSPALVTKLSDLEAEKSQLKDSIYSMELELSKYSFQEEKFREMFQTARKMFQDGKLSTNKALIDKYVDKIMIYKTYIEIYFNLGGTSTFPTKDIKRTDNKDQQELPETEAPASVSALQKLLSASHSREEIKQKSTS